MGVCQMNKTNSANSPSLNNSSYGWRVWFGNMTGFFPRTGWLLPWPWLALCYLHIHGLSLPPGPGTHTRFHVLSRQHTEVRSGVKVSFFRGAGCKPCRYKTYKRRDSDIRSRASQLGGKDWKVSERWWISENGFKFSAHLTPCSIRQTPDAVWRAGIIDCPQRVCWASLGEGALFLCLKITAVFDRVMRYRCMCSNMYLWCSVSAKDGGAQDEGSYQVSCRRHIAVSECIL